MQTKGRSEERSQVSKLLNRQKQRDRKCSACRNVEAAFRHFDESLRHCAWVDAELFHAREQGSTLEAKAGSCTLGPTDTSMGLLKDAQELVTLASVRHLSNGFLCRTVPQV